LPGALPGDCTVTSTFKEVSLAPFNPGAVAGGLLAVSTVPEQLFFSHNGRFFRYNLIGNISEWQMTNSSDIIPLGLIQTVCMSKKEGKASQLDPKSNGLSKV
jgi:hypothetical protein